MPKTVDILIGLVLVMLLMSMVVTTLTQFLASLINLRGKALRHGVADLLTLLDRGLERGKAMRLATQLLRDPLIASPGVLGGRPLAGAVHREELTKLILEFAAKKPPEGPWWVRFFHKESFKRFREWLKRLPLLHALCPTRTALRELHERVVSTLNSNGILDPARVLEDVRSTALELEKSNPELSNSSRMTIAILHNAGGDYIGKLNGWFDQTMDRVSGLFTTRIRFVTVLVATIVALAVQLDTLALFDRLGSDDQLRGDLVKKALATDQFDPTKLAAQNQTARTLAGASGTTLPASSSGGAAASTSSPGQSQSGATAQPAVSENIRRMTRDLGGIVALPASWKDWNSNWHESSGAFSFRMLVGIIISAVLMSLGAPFWYEVLKDLVRFRSLIAQKDDDQRTERQTTQGTGQPPTAQGVTTSEPGTGATAPTVSPGALPIALQGGERGDLRAVG